LFIDTQIPGQAAYFVQVSGGDSITIEHNTVQQIGNIFSVYNFPTKNFVFTNNIVQYNNYGFVCFIQGPPCPDFPYCNCFQRELIKGNLIADNLNQLGANQIDQRILARHMFVSSFERLGFVNYAQGDWRLASSSRYKGKGLDGKDPGVDFVTFNASGVQGAVEGLKFGAN
jgi:hypothetical protein